MSDIELMWTLTRRVEDFNQINDLKMNEIGINRILRILEAAFDLGEHLLNLSDTKILGIFERTELRKPSLLVTTAKRWLHHRSNE